MDGPTLLYTGMITAFAYSGLDIYNRIRQYLSFDRTYGHREKITLNDLLEKAEAENTELPSFNIYVPALKESEVIEQTIRNLAKSNYPMTHFKINIISHIDDTVPDPEHNTTSVVEKTAKDINSKLGFELVKSIVVSKEFNGYFPEDTSKDRKNGKSRTLNYAIKKTHEDNERDERSYLLGIMFKYDALNQIENMVDTISTSQDRALTESLIARHLDESSPLYIGSLFLSSELESLVHISNSLSGRRILSEQSENILSEYINLQAENFFYDVKDVDINSKKQKHLEVMKGKQFLRDVMLEVENKPQTELIAYAEKREEELKETRPVLSKLLNSAQTTEEVYQLVKTMMNSRWMVVYDADADAPRDVLRYLSAKIMDDPNIMAFQGPVAQVGNLEDVTSIPRLGGIHLTFNHATLYPRMLQKKNWAHPLAGTNYCLSLEGMVTGKPITRDTPYRESQREFFIYFKPESLTEDLECGLRLFQEYGINAELQPFTEVEQVPPDRKTFVRQQIRWAEGTLALLEEIKNSRLPFDQKLYYASYPFKVVLTAILPVISTAYLIGYTLGAIHAPQIYGNLPVVLAAANVLYSLEFVLPYLITDKYIKANYPYDELYKLGRSIIDKRQEAYNAFELSDIVDMIGKFKEGMKKNGRIGRFANIRLTDEDYNPTSLYIYDLDKVVAKTATVPTKKNFENLITNLESIVTVDAQSMGLIYKKNALYTKSGRKIDVKTLNMNESRIQNEINRMDVIFHMEDVNAIHEAGRIAEIAMMALPYIYTQVGPTLTAIQRKLTGTASTSWDKTARTAKKQL
jgi:cellulose synthase/poly-beta-1,6-N-acetylglucosamine synthase-like glycosyltransferase